MCVRERVCTSINRLEGAREGRARGFPKNKPKTRASPSHAQAPDMHRHKTCADTRHAQTPNTRRFAYTRVGVCARRGRARAARACARGAGVRDTWARMLTRMLTTLVCLRACEGKTHTRVRACEGKNTLDSKCVRACANKCQNVFCTFPCREQLTIYQLYEQELSLWELSSKLDIWSTTC